MKRTKLIFIFALLCIVLSACSTSKEEEAKKEYEQEQLAEQKEREKIAEESEKYMAHPHPVAEEFAGGSGTEDDPYQIETAEQMALFSKVVNGPYEPSQYKEEKHYMEAYYILTKDIEMNDTTNYENWLEQPPEYAWTSIGGTATDETDRTNNFYGHLDGKGHTISGLYLCSSWYPKKSESVNFGLFGYVSQGSIKNLTIKKSLYRVFNVGYQVGGIAGSVVNGVVENCSSNVKIYCREGNYIGGIIGESRESKIEKCTFTGNLYAQDVNYDMAGIAAHVSGGEIVGCSNKGTFSITDKTLLGGIVGEITASAESVINTEVDETNGSEKDENITKIIDCKNEAPLTNGSGIVASVLVTKNGLVIENCQNTASIQLNVENSIGGGLIGDIRVGGSGEDYPAYVKVINCMNSGELFCNKDNSCIGGNIGRAIIRDHAKLIIDGCSNESTITGTTQLGGIIANALLNGAESDINVANCKNAGAIVGIESAVGGIVGDLCVMGVEGAQSAEIYDNENTSLVQGGAYGVGGILGRQLGQHGDSSDSISIYSCINKGEINGIMPGVFAGGIIGYIPALEEKVIINSCVNEGNVVLVVQGEQAVSEETKDKVYGIAGGIIGGAQDTISMNSCKNEGEVTVADDVAWKTWTNDLLGITFEGGEPVFGFF